MGRAIEERFFTTMGFQMNTSMLTRVRKHFASGIAHIDRHNQRQWVKSVRFLGAKWLLHPENNVGKKA